MGKKILIIISMVFVTILTVFLAMNVPNWIEQNNVKKNETVSKFDPKVYTGWAYAYYAINRENQVLYLETPKTLPDKTYPKIYLPELLQNYGIAVEKDYSGKYVFTQQKQLLLDFYNTESSVLLEASDKFKSVNNKTTANDAVVISALNSYTVLIDKFNVATNSVTLEDAHTNSMGSYIKKQVGTDNLSTPIGYGQLAQSYLKTNLDKYKPSFKKYISNSSHSGTDIDFTKSVMNIQ